MFLLGFPVNEYTFLKFVRPPPSYPYDKTESGVFLEHFLDLISTTKNFKAFMTEIYRLEHIYDSLKTFRRENNINASGPTWDYKPEYLQLETDYIKNVTKNWECTRYIPDCFSLMEIRYQGDVDSDKEIVGFPISSLEQYWSIMEQYDKYRDDIEKYLSLTISPSIWDCE